MPANQIASSGRKSLRWEKGGHVWLPFTRNRSSNTNDGQQGNRVARTNW